MSVGEKLFAAGAVGLGLLALVKYRHNNPTAPGSGSGGPLTNPKLSLIDKLVSDIYSSSPYVPGASNPTTFAGQTAGERKIATVAGRIAPAVAGKIPIIGPAASKVAGVDTQVNVTQVERATRGTAQIVQGNFKAGASNIVGSQVTMAVQPIKSAAAVIISGVGGLFR